MEETTVSDSQCGFRAGKDYANIMFYVCQLVEKAIEHNTKMFLLLIDLFKAYDLVPRAALWCTLWKYGVSDVMIELMWSNDDGMSAIMTVGSAILGTEWFVSGVYYCSHLFFKLLVDLVNVMFTGIKAQFELGGRLVGERARRLNSFVLSECIFADDTALVCSST